MAANTPEVDRAEYNKRWHDSWVGEELQKGQVRKVYRHTWIAMGLTYQFTATSAYIHDPSHQLASFKLRHHDGAASYAYSIR
jgi:flavin-dependent dehydrogenase